MDVEKTNGTLLDLHPSAHLCTLRPNMCLQYTKFNTFLCIPPPPPPGDSKDWNWGILHARKSSILNCIPRSVLHHEWKHDGYMRLSLPLLSISINTCPLLSQWKVGLVYAWTVTWLHLLALQCFQGYWFLPFHPGNQGRALINGWLLIVFISSVGQHEGECTHGGKWLVVKHLSDR